MDWHVFNFDCYIGAYRTYSDAVFSAQCQIGIAARPERLHAGFYTLRGHSTFYDIATTRMAEVQGFDLEELKKKEHAA